MKKFILVVFLIFIKSMGIAQSITNREVYQTSPFGFSQAVVSGNLVFLSGQVGWDKNKRLTGNGDFGSQLTQSMKNIQLLLNQCGSSMERIVMLRFYVVEMNDANKKLINLNLQQTYKGERQPATSLIGVNALARPELLIEVEAIAELLINTSKNE